MIDVARAQSALEAIDGDQVVMTKKQYGDMLTEVARGNAARITLTNVRSIANAGAFAAGLNA